MRFVLLLLLCTFQSLCGSCAVELLLHFSSTWRHLLWTSTWICEGASPTPCSSRQVLKYVQRRMSLGFHEFVSKISSASVVLNIFTDGQWTLGLFLWFLVNKHFISETYVSVINAQPWAGWWIKKSTSIHHRFSISKNHCGLRPPQTTFSVENNIENLLVICSPQTQVQ